VKIVFAGHSRRGAASLRALLDEGHTVPLVLAQPGSESGDVARLAHDAGVAIDFPLDVNASETVRAMRAVSPEVIVLAGYSQIIRQNVLDVAPLGCVNLHAGRLPHYRGSSPLNWALINGEPSFTLSVIQVDTGVDTGDVLVDRSFDIGPDETIADLHDTANTVFPELLVEALRLLESGNLVPRPQAGDDAAYYPLRFPDDGLILWDTLTAQEAHNRIRALSDPYPGAFTYHGDRRVKLARSRLTQTPFFGDPGRVYRLAGDEALVCAADRCLWISVAHDESGGSGLASIARYDRLATVRWLAVEAAARARG
jgi:methionyl-tRNA formyltransferase